MASISNLYIDQGTAFSSSIDMTNDDGTPFNLTGYTCQGQIRTSYIAEEAIDFAITLDITNSKLNFSLTKLQTAAMKAGRYVYDIMIDNNSGNAVRVVEGILVINPGVTR